MEWPDFQDKVCSFDIETNEKDEIYAFGAVFRGKEFQARAPYDIQQILRAFDEFAADAEFILGHNILHHDLPHCRRLNPHAAFLHKPVIDTLFLSPLAFPENPYHRLVKNYKLVRDSLNDPLADARLAMSLFQDQWQALQVQQAESELLSFYHYAFSDNSHYRGLQDVILAMGATPANTDQVFELFKKITRKRVCQTAFANVIQQYLDNPDARPALAYCLAWLRVAGGNSVLPPWVREQFQEVAVVLRQLRDVPCSSPDCQYCQQTHNPVYQLQRYFGFDSFRLEPKNAEGSSLQQDIVQAAMQDQSVLAILPTGGGKSLCYQLPALVRYQRRGVLTIVISPLQALMKDQVDNLRSKTGAPSVAALYGALTGPERGEVIKSVQMGDVALLYVSPEQLRNRGFRNAIEHREIGCWVFDEAHCLSGWGHDFRPDYLYAARFISEFADQQKAVLPPVQCFTATAKQDVKLEIKNHFKSRLGLDLQVFEGGVDRHNLSFEVQTVNSVDKYSRIHSLLKEYLPDDVDSPGSAIIYCATRKQTEEIETFLKQQDWSIEAFHAGKDAAEKRHIQENFIHGLTRVITATNAFGMGVDKENVRLVIHADIPGSLENYLQEAGRAGRDQQEARCILLFDENDIDKQFKLSACSQISKQDIALILRGLRRHKKDDQGNVVLTAGELLQDEQIETSFSPEDYNAATKVITAVSWLEQSGFVERNENRTQVFQGRPRVKNMQQAEQKINTLNLSQRQKKRWLAILEALFNADIDEGFSADELALLSAFAEADADEKQNLTASQRVIRTLFDMSQEGLIQKNLLLTAFVRYKVNNPSLTLLNKICQLENALIALLQEQAPDASEQEWQLLSLRHVNQHLLDQGFADCRPDILQNLLVSISRDGQGMAADKGSLFLRHSALDQYQIKLQRGWPAIREIVRRRQAVAQIVLNAIFQKIPPGTSASADLLVEFSIEDLVEALNKDLEMAGVLKDKLAAVERALNFLHEQKVITLQQGLAVFRQAMTIQIMPESKGRRYNKKDFQPLEHHYKERIFQIHVMNEYALKGLEKIGQALSFVLAYFSQDKSEFVKQYFNDRKDILEQATSQQAWQRIVTDLRNLQQQQLVTQDEDENMLILAGPGSGKTRVVVHRCAYLLRVKQVPARSILIMCFNRNAATELKQRLFELVGPEARAVTIQTYHGLSLRLSGHAVTGTLQTQAETDKPFENMIQQAIDLLTGKQQGLADDKDELRERLLAGYRFILVDEYQDIDDLQYQLISALAGRHTDEEARLSILAVGDDDQNIYQFRGANIGFIRQFEEDYQARKFYLVENYRSSANIIQAANQLIQHNHDRMKQQHPIKVNRGREKLLPGGRWEKLDPLAKGRVQVISCQNETAQAQAVKQELSRIKQLESSLDWSQCAILSKEWKLLNAVRSALEADNIPLSLALSKDQQLPPWRIRENQQLIQAIKNSPETLCRASDWLEYLLQQCEGQPNIWQQQLIRILQSWQTETDNIETGKQLLQEYLFETLSEQKKESRLGQGVFLSTIHSVKGMEFRHVFILDGGWGTVASEENRRLYYVAMTRAKETLCLLDREDSHNPYLEEIAAANLFYRQMEPGCMQSSAPDKHYHILGLKDVDLSFAGRCPANHPIHTALSNTRIGDKVTLIGQGDKLLIQKDAVTIAALSRSARQQWQSRLSSIQVITVVAMVRRYKTDNEESFQARCKVEHWEVPVLEIVTSD